VHENFSFLGCAIFVVVGVVPDFLKACSGLKSSGSTRLTMLHVPGDLNLQQQQCEKLKSCKDNKIKGI